VEAGQVSRTREVVPAVGGLRWVGPVAAAAAAFALEAAACRAGLILEVVERGLTGPTMGPLEFWEQMLGQNFKTEGFGGLSSQQADSQPECQFGMSQHAGEDRLNAWRCGLIQFPANFRVPYLIGREGVDVAGRDRRNALTVRTEEIVTGGRGVVRATPTRR
jgi:hypothetical protein